ncbi:MAG: S-layer homology domain-containing protein, partial [Lysinibacillus sp.]
KDANGKAIVYEPNQLKWSVEGNIGTITSGGKFTANKANGSGKVTATLGTKSVSVNVNTAKTELFKDVPSNYPYYKEIEYLTKNKIITGYQEDGTFRPGNQLTRGHAAVIISRALKLDTNNVSNPKFKDIPTSHPYYKEIAAVVEVGIMSGKSKDVFDSKANLTRAQMAKIIAIAYNLEGTSKIVFKDVAKDNWAYDYIQALAANKVTTGYEGNLYKPFQPITRAHFSVFLYRAIHR